MVDLGIRQKHPGDRCRADAVNQPWGELLELLTGVGGGVDEEPRPLAPADRQRRLRTWSCADTSARRLAHLTTAIPLRKSPAGGRAENPNLHFADEAGRSLSRALEAAPASCRLPLIQVGRNLGAQIDALELRLDPRHIGPPLIRVV